MHMHMHMSQHGHVHVHVHTRTYTHAHAHAHARARNLTVGRPPRPPRPPVSPRGRARIQAFAPEKQVKCVACNFILTGLEPKHCCSRCLNTNGADHGPRCEREPFADVTAMLAACVPCEPPKGDGEGDGSHGEGKGGEGEGKGGKGEGGGPKEA